MPMYRTVIGVIVGIFFILQPAHGQVFQNEPAISITANPEDPEPGETVAVTLVSYETNLDLALISWQYGPQTLVGYGETEFEVRAPLGESASAVYATITLEDGRKLEKTITIAPAAYDIAFEAMNVKAPPFYLGKKLPIRENTIRVAVISPQTAAQTAYTWRRNDRALPAKGASRQYVEFKNTETERSEKITVQIATPGKQSERTLFIPIMEPRVLYYEYQPLFGLKTGKNITNTVIGHEDTVSIFTLPLGLNTDTIPAIAWTLSGNPVSNQSNPYLLSFKKPTDTGTVSVSTQIENERSLYQNFKGALGLIF